MNIAWFILAVFAVIALFGIAGPLRDIGDAYKRWMADTDAQAETRPHDD